MIFVDADVTLAPDATAQDRRPDRGVRPRPGQPLSPAGRHHRSRAARPAAAAVVLVDDPAARAGRGLIAALADSGERSGAGDHPRGVPELWGPHRRAPRGPRGHRPCPRGEGHRGPRQRHRRHGPGHLPDVHRPRGAHRRIHQVAVGGVRLPRRVGRRHGDPDVRLRAAARRRPAGSNRRDPRPRGSRIRRRGRRPDPRRPPHGWPDQRHVVAPAGDPRPGRSHRPVVAPAPPRRADLEGPRGPYPRHPADG